MIEGKKNLQDQYLEDFQKIRGALLSQIANNSKLDQSLIQQFTEEDYSNLEEHAILSKIILDSTKVLSEAYKYAPEIIKKIEENTPKEKEKINLDDLLSDSDTDKFQQLLNESEKKAEKQRSWRVPASGSGLPHERWARREGILMPSERSHRHGASEVYTGV